MATLYDLFESVRPAVLSHGTGPDEAVQIIFQNVLLGHTAHMAQAHVKARAKHIDKFDDIYGVSLTRDVNFARKWTSGEGVVLQFDGNLLKRDFRIIPFDFYQNRRESEEFLIGNLKPVNRYLVGIAISEETARTCEERDEDYDEDYRMYTQLLTHPLLRVDGHRWAPGGKILKSL